MFLFNRKRKERLPVLMYHKVSADGSKDDLTIPELMLERQLHYLKKEGYSTILLSQLVNYVLRQVPLPPRPVLLTFDDGYKDNYDLLYPLLQRYGLVANIFLVPAHIANDRHTNTNTYLSLTDIVSIDPSVIEFGMHSFDHKNYAELSSLELEYDLGQCRTALEIMGIKFQSCVAFPYGAFPRRNRKRQAVFFKTLLRNKTVLAFRIGNRLNPLPIKNPLLIQRLDVKGNLHFEKFVKLLRNGKTPFS